MKNTITVLLLLFYFTGCATTSTSHVQQGKEADLKQINSVAVSQFQCGDEIVAQAVRNTVIEMLLPSGVKILNTESSADAIIKGSITFSHDAVTSGGAYFGQTTGGAYASGAAGSYVSGITAQVVMGDEIIAAASETQVRTDMWIPDPPEVMARKIGEKIKKMLGR